MKTTDDLKEMFDIVDEKDRVIGQATREEVHKNKKLIHRSIGVVVFNQKGEIFLQQRSAAKDTDPLLWTISCSGHVLAGDNYEKTAHRELIEELGIDLRLIPVAKSVCTTSVETELAMLYKAYAQGPFFLNVKEIKKGKFFSRTELERKIKRKKIKLSYMGKLALSKLGFLNQEKSVKK